MSIEKTLHDRSSSQCELCGKKETLEVYVVSGARQPDERGSALLCLTCREQIENPEKVDPNHWRCLNDSIWSPVSAVQVLAWRMLNQLRGEGWPVDLLEMLYLDDETLEWAKKGLEETNEEIVIHLDSNGTPLLDGDTVILTKSLDVKGANFTAKMGTAVRGISLVEGNAEQIEGRVNGTKIVILTKYVKKSN